MTVRVLLVEDHTIVREGLKAMLALESDLQVVGEAPDGNAGVKLAKELHPDVVVMDLNLPGLNGVDATQAVVQACPSTRVLVLSMYGGPEHVRPAVRAGASGYLVKGTGVSELVSGIRAISRGEPWFSHGIAAVLLRDPDGGAGSLTPREREVLRYVAEGLSSAEIARSLDLSVKTVESHRSRIMTKLDVTNAAGLVREAIRLGLVSAE
ncbi:MAG: response regulator transcription factor [Deltaproteobacteria bacterium]|nr:response regulator transcription factor [Deltaproteobacteria bacterium]